MSNDVCGTSQIRTSLIARLLVVAAPISYLLLYFLQGKYLLLGNTDRVDLQLPLVLAARAALQAGQGPWWNPIVFNGTPLWGNPALFIWYPLNWPVLIVPDSMVILTSSLIAYIHYVGTFITAFILFRVLIKNERWAAFSALAYGFSLPVAYGLTVGDAHLPVYLFLPLSLYFIHTLDQRSIQWTITGLTLTVAAQLTGGFLQLTVYSVGLLVCYSSYIAWQSGSGQIRLQTLSALTLALVLAALLAIPTIIPTLVLARETSRFGLAGPTLSWQYALYDLPTSYDRLLRLFVPNGFGFDIDYPFPVNYLETMAAFCGVSTLLMAGIAVMHQDKPVVVYFWGTMTLIILLLVFTPLAIIQILFFGGVTTILHGRLAFLLPLTVATLAGLGSKIIDQSKPLTWQMALTVPGILLAIIILSGNQIVSMLGTLSTYFYTGWSMIDNPFELTIDDLPTLEFVRAILIIGIITIILLRSLNRRIYLVWVMIAILLLEVVPSTYLMHQIQHYPLMVTANTPFYLFDQIGSPLPVPKSELKQFRILITEQESSRSDAGIGVQRSGEANQGIVYGYLSPWGYANSYSSRYVTLITNIGVDSKYYSQREVYFDPIIYPRLADLTSVGRLFEAGKKWFPIIKRNSALSRASLFFDYQVEVDPVRAAKLLGQPEFDVKQTVLLAHPPKNVVGPPDPQATVEIIKDTPNQVIIQTNVSTSALLLLTDSWALGWQATIDETDPTEIIEANVAFRAVEVPGGKHRITFTYHPPLLGLSMGLASLGLLGMVIILVMPLPQWVKQRH